ncbi:hypothetical protein HOI26_05945 [Candidatus Woesearchaeota archaeon]|jgi:hypothetical protein|nr:hypothetical protein [Candidatus Woesearchaeota archaeon]MBT5740610.1 hypothetical protein [Candidatus Woesearchaeota archaeon]
MPKRKIETAERLFSEFQPVSLKYKDIFDFSELYTAFHDWLQEHDWGCADGDLDRWETYYLEKIGKGGAKDIKSWWRLKKNPADTEGFTYYLDINFHAIALMKTEIIKNGQKIKSNKGELTITIVPWLDSHYQKDYSDKDNKAKNKFLTWMKGVLSGGLLRQIKEQRKKELYQEVYQLQNFLKQWFKLKRYLPYEETKNYSPSYAWPSHLREE